MINESRIDILLATHKGENYVKELLNPLLNQDYPNWHIFISDDHSYNNTVTIINEYKYENPKKS